MCIEDLYGLFYELKLTGKENRNLFMILRWAIYYYLKCLEENNLPDTIEFTLKTEYIKQTKILDALGIIVTPEKWEEKAYMPVAIDEVKEYTAHRQKTVVIFPTSLLTTEQREDVLTRALKSKSNK